MRSAPAETTLVDGLEGPLLKTEADEAISKKKLNQSGTTAVVFYIIGSIISAVCIVVSNKEVFESGFSFPLTLSWVAYCFTYLYYKILQWSGVWKPQKSLPAVENIKVAIASIGSISFMNLCLLTNTVAIYQICKFVVIPCTLMIQKLFFQVNTNGRVLLALAVVLAGVAWATMTSVNAGTMSFMGIVYATLAVVSTSVYRIWQDTKQNEFCIGPTDFMASMAGWQSGLGFVVAVAVEFPPIESDNTVPKYFVHAYNDSFGGQFPQACAWMIGTCVCALIVNWTSFGLIGKTGPVAYAVVGHAKTVLTIFMGMALFPEKESPETLRADIVGCGVALCGVIAYGHFEYSLTHNKPDVVEQMCPALVGKRAEEVDDQDVVSPHRQRHRQRRARTDSDFSDSVL